MRRSGGVVAFGQRNRKGNGWRYEEFEQKEKNIVLTKRALERKSAIPIPMPFVIGWTSACPTVMKN